MNPKPTERIHPYPTRGDVASGIGCLFVIGVLFVLPFTLFFLVKAPEFVFLILLFPIILMLVLGQKIFGELVAFRNRRRFMELSLTTKAKVLDNRWIRHEDSDEYQITIEFEANTVSKGIFSQKLKLDIPQALYEKINAKDAVIARYSTKLDVPQASYNELNNTVTVRYSRLNPRIALLEGEVGASQAIDTRQYPGGSIVDRPGIDLFAGGCGSILFALFGVVLILSLPSSGKAVGIVLVILGGGLAWYFATEKSRSIRKQELRTNDFLISSTATEAKILSKDSEHNQITIQYTVSEQAVSPIIFTLVVNTDYSTSQRLKDKEVVTVRHSPDDPRFALIEGEF